MTYHPSTSDSIFDFWHFITFILKGYKTSIKNDGADHCHHRHHCHIYLPKKTIIINRWINTIGRLSEKHNAQWQPVLMKWNFKQIITKTKQRQTRNGAQVHENDAAAFRYAAFLRTLSSWLRISSIFSWNESSHAYSFRTCTENNHSEEICSHGSVMLIVVLNCSGGGLKTWFFVQAYS